MFKKSVLLFAITTQLFAAPVGSQGSVASSMLSSEGLGNIAYGSSQLLSAGSQLSVTAIKTVGDFTFITLKSAGHSAFVTLRVARHVSGNVLLGVGQTVHVVTTGAGQLLISSGQVITFLPNEMGKSLLYSAI
ncbi:hypothetical protein E3226_003080 [Legionella geestiana]|uniref:hypothetical protein n=1 Tax=Legionella geestiana TaxID=45065 RepID=UPI001092D870|nr:hypothetical protein [Legionella geestiana]QDQ39451.1 hypothetical protein E3226_003080 [Legionella geestiana]